VAEVSKIAPSLRNTMQHWFVAPSLSCRYMPSVVPVSAAVCWNAHTI
jgi:hypothetical protein